LDLLFHSHKGDILDPLNDLVPGPERAYFVQQLTQLEARLLLLCALLLRDHDLLFDLAMQEA
jgi:hypothetical protein